MPWWLLGVVLLAGGLQPAFARAEDEPYYDDLEVIDMTPDDAASVSLRHMAAPFASMVRGTSHWYKEREVFVDTTPSGGWVDLFYVRGNFQKRFEQAQAPVKVILPARIKTGSRDSLRIRAFREGYRQESVSIPVGSDRDRVVLDLEPLPNFVKALSHRYFAGRSTLVFLTTESPTFRVQEAADGFTLILSETGKSAEAGASLTGIESPMLQGAVAQQLGEDLVIKVEFTPGSREKGVKLRSRPGRDVARDLYQLSLDVVPASGNAGAVSRAKKALERLDTADVSGCALQFDQTLREGVGTGALSRALTPSGAFTDPYLRAAMRRLGEISPDGGVVQFTGGMQYRPSVPIELEVALSQAADARGYLVLLRDFVREMEDEHYQRETYRSLVAPELDPGSFGAILDRAQESEAVCLASR